MAALNFPNNPSLNQIYTANDTSWRWNGSSWVRVNLGTQGVQGTQGLQGTQGVQGTAGDTLWRQGPLGISTSENVGIATTAATAFALDVYGNARVSGILTVGSSSVIINGVNNTVNVGTSATIGTTNTFLKTSLEVTGVSTFQNNVFINGSLIAGAGGGGVSIGDDLITRNLYASGVSTFIGAIAANSATFSGNVTIGGTLKYEDVVNVDSVGIATARSGLRITGGGLDVVGVSTFAGAIDANGDLDVDGHTELDELRVTGVSTFTANLDIDAAIDVDGHTELDELNVSGVSTFAGITTVTGPTLFAKQLNISGIATARQFSDYRALVGAASSATETFTVTVASKTSNHRYFGSGSGSGYFFDGRESPFITLLPGKTYRFDQADASNAAHQLRFYLEADRTTEYTTNITFNGTAGSAGAYTEITVTDTTPIVLHYQCVNHGYMGNSVQTNSNFINTPYSINTLGGLSVSGVSTFSSDLDINSAIDVDGHTELDNLNVSGVSTFVGVGTFQNSLYVGGTLYAPSLNITGGASLGDDLTTRNLNASGIATVAGATDLNGDLDVDGHTELDNVNISGIVTAFNIDVDGHTELDELRVTGVSTFTANLDIDAAIDVDGHTELDNVNISGILTATSANFSGNVSVLGNLIYEDVVNVDSVGIATARSGLRITGGGLDVVGVATFANAIDANGDIDVDGHTELDNVNVSGVLTATSFVGNGTLIEDTVGIQSSGFSIGTSRYLNFVGTGNTFAVVGNRIDISISGNTGAGGTWNTYNAGIATTKSVGIHTSNLDNPALTGVGNSFQGLYISNGMIIHDNVLTGNHYIGTAYNGLMAGPVNVEGSLTIDGVWVVV